MRAVIQRANDASVQVKDDIVGRILFGLVVLIGVTHEDTIEDVQYLVKKIINLRIFEDEHGKMNHSLKDIDGELLSISQFTLYGDTRKGRRPSFIKAARPDHATALYNAFNDMVRAEGIKVETGQFGAMMDVRFTNVGPVTIVIDSEDQ
ncbi:D-aminoacyl-tRNA deacylase [Lentibacillus saliphilus]|uniref:D-aminoacyl-tRNA deacylase n=1 Tax=Lentibacillus saliphilus TaxID=2737028 RepID=UPI001C310F8E|nr:D-aminoacyl-tRNA deacylase [Lentibacillus saliphilus]